MAEFTDPGQCVIGLDHDWEYLVADGTAPYWFCRNCKKTLFNGRIYALRDSEGLQDP